MFGFTKQEKTIILFLIVTFTIGTGIIYLKKLTYQNTKKEYKSIYEELDKQFYEISKNDSITFINEGKKTQDTISIKININTADENELIKLPGIGPKLLKEIIQYRNKNGKFKNVNEIIKVKGIGKKKFEKISQFIYVE
jgi:comEA protein